MRRYYTKTFIKFFFGFLAILIVSFAVMLVAAESVPTAPVDNIAVPQ